MSRASWKSSAGRSRERADDGPTPRPGPYESPAPLEQVLEDELKYIHHHRHHDKDPEVVARSYVGLALSGGGIRSATTNLGVLQALSRLGILPLVDYLSTVSGGAYIGACMSSLLSWNGSRQPSGSDNQDSCNSAFKPEEQPAFSTEWKHFPFRAEERDEEGRLGKGLVAHLRTHGNFLITRTGVFSREALRGAAAILVGTLFNAAGFVLTLFAGAALYLTLVLFGAPSLPTVLAWSPRQAAAVAPAVAVPDTSRPALVAGDSTIVRTKRVAANCGASPETCARITTATTPLQPPTFWNVLGRNLRVYQRVLFYGPSQVDTTRAPSGPIWERVPWSRATVALAIAFLVGILGGLLSMLWMRHSFRAYLENESADEITHERGDSAEDGFESRVLKRMFYFFAALSTAMLVAFWHIVRRSDEIVIPLIPAAALLGAWLSTYALGVLYLPHQASYTRRLRSLAAEYHAVTGWLLAVLVAAGFAPAVIYALRDHATGTGIGALAAFLATRLLLTRAATGPRRFALSPFMFRLLLNIAVASLILVGFLFAAAVLAQWVNTPRAAIVAVALLAVFVAGGWLVNMNRIGLQYFYRDRLAETYLLTELPNVEGRLELFRDAMETPLHELHGVCPDDREWRNPAPYQLISAAINLAGSRDLTRKDRKSGYWLFSRLYCGSTHTGFRWTEHYRKGETKLANAVAITGAAVSSGMGHITFFAQALAATVFNVRLGAWVENPRYPESCQRQEFGVFWPRYLLRECLMDTTENARLVNLSDGGHTGDNVGIYPLLQRHCKVIIACDAECDSTLAFNSFTEALRQAYVDLGIDVDIDLSMLRPNPDTKLSRSHCAVGRIHYPDRPDQASWLVYIKSSITGDEPAPMLNYRARFPAFPHESTVDQFFDDAQFEAYRSLGVHVTEDAFGEWASSDEFKSLLDFHAPQHEAAVSPAEVYWVSSETVTVGLPTNDGNRI